MRTEGTRASSSCSIWETTPHDPPPRLQPMRGHCTSHPSPLARSSAVPTASRTASSRWGGRPSRRTTSCWPIILATTMRSFTRTNCTAPSWKGVPSSDVFARNHRRYALSGSGLSLLTARTNPRPHRPTSFQTCITTVVRSDDGVSSALPILYTNRSVAATFGCLLASSSLGPSGDSSWSADSAARFMPQHPPVVGLPAH